MAKQNLYQTAQRLKLVSIIVAGLIVLVSAYFTNRLAQSLAEEEQKRIEIWAEATRLLSITDIDDNMVNSLVLKIIEGNTTIPVIIDYKGNIDSRNVKLPPKGKDANAYYAECIERFSERHPPIVLNLLDDHLYVYYDDSLLLKRLVMFPYVQLTVIVVFALVAFFAFGSTKRAEQNQVWVGLSKETAHQLGTPLSSLMAWLDMLESQGTDPEIIGDMGKDVQRLSTIAERFSKIGSQPEREPADVSEVIGTAVDYMQHRISGKVHITVHTPEEKLEPQPLCRPLIEWVFENLCKNAIDAMDGEGNIDITLTHDESRYYIDVKDTGKGIARNRFKTIFHPGYTTKRRGWGLGLTLVKRIIEEYHNGRIYVKESEIGKGTTFRIEMKRA